MPTRKKDARLKDFVRPFLVDNRDMLAHLPEQDRLILEQKAIPEEHKRGEWLFRQGGYPTGVFWLVSGKAKIFQGLQDGERRTLYLYADGDLIAYRQLIAEQPHPVSAVLLEDSVIRLIPADTFRGLIQTSPFFARNMLTGLAREFTVWINLLNAFKKYTVRQRIMLILLILHVQDGASAAPAGAVTLTRTDIAEFVGASLETVVRMLKTISADGLIGLDGREIAILEPLRMIDELTASG